MSVLADVAAEAFEVSYSGVTTYERKSHKLGESKGFKHANSTWNWMLKCWERPPGD